MLKTIYRVAHSSEKSWVSGALPAGPYGDPDGLSSREARRLCNRLLNAHSGDPFRPSPNSHLSGLGGIDESEACAFDSMDALKTWFGYWLGQLGEVGFELHVYEVPEEAVRVGTYGQVCFKYVKTSPARRIPIQSIVQKEAK